MKKIVLLLFTFIFLNLSTNANEFESFMEINEKSEECVEVIFRGYSGEVIDQTGSCYQFAVCYDPTQIIEFSDPDGIFGDPGDGLGYYGTVMLVSDVLCDQKVISLSVFELC